MGQFIFVFVKITCQLNHGLDLTVCQEEMEDNAK